jgi:hypothetical protein
MGSITTSVIETSQNNKYINNHENNPSLKSIRYVVMSYLNRKGIYDMKHYKRLEQIALEGLTQLNLYDMETVEVAYLEMNEIGVVKFPSDFVDYTKIGIPVNGRLYTLTVNEEILEPRFDKCGQEVFNPDHNPNTVDVGGYYFSDHFRNGRYVGGLYGVGGGFNVAYVKMDRQRRQFIIQGTVPRSEIVMEYISTGIKQDGSTMVPTEALEPLRRWIDMVVTENDRRSSEGAIARTARAYDLAVDEMRHFITCPTREEYQDKFYESLTQGVKR